METYPLHSLHLTHLLDQLSNHLLAIDIYAIVCQFLSNDLKFLDSLSDQMLNLRNDVSIFIMWFDYSRQAAVWQGLSVKNLCHAAFVETGFDRKHIFC